MVRLSGLFYNNSPNAEIPLWSIIRLSGDFSGGVTLVTILKGSPFVTAPYSLIVVVNGGRNGL